MKAVYVEVPESLLAERHRLGLDARDEVWEGVLHMVPPPSNEHQRVVGKLYRLFETYFERHSLGAVRLGIGVRDLKGTEENYRVPEWFALRKGREGLLAPESSFLDAGPDVVVEVCSPGDETSEKTPFYDRLGVGEVLVIDRDTKRVEILRRIGGSLRPALPGPEGWLYSEGLRASFRAGEKEGRAVVLVLFEIGHEEHVV